MSDTNVGAGMVPCRPNCRCSDCTIERLRADLARVTAELEAAKRDAARYRWLRDFGDDLDPTVEDAVMVNDHLLRANDLDEAIDAAMRDTGSAGG